MSLASVERLSSLATEPYRRGAEILELPLGAEAGGVVPVQPYDFREYRARHGADPEDPRYVLVALDGTGRDPLRVEVDLTAGGAETQTEVELPASAPPGSSYAVPLPAGFGPDDRLLRLRRIGPGPSSWRLLALLGNLSKLLWVLGAEKDTVLATLMEVRAQRSLASARAASLDLLGADLRVPRFPPRQHSFDPDTVALYHLDEHPVGAGGAIEDETAAFGLPGHPGVNQGAASGAQGKLGNGFALPGTGPSGHLQISHHADFNVPPARSFTVELFVNLEPAPAPGESDEVRAVAVKGGLSAAGDHTSNGWALVTGPFRGVPDNLRWSGRSAAGTFEAFADLDLADGRFHHVAGTVDRDAGRARLFVDGAEVAGADVSELGGFGNAQAVRIGRSGTGHQLSGVVDEVRVSHVARIAFDPVLGEGDEAYRRRLALFERWLLPTPRNLLDAVHRAVSIEGEAEPFVLVETDRPTAGTSSAVRLAPAALGAGQHLDREGGTRTSAAEVCGTAADEPGFPAELLVRHDHANAEYAGEDARRMQAGAVRALEALLGLLADEAPGGTLRVERAYDPTAGGAGGADLHRVGRALLLTHDAIAPGALAAFLYRAGFDFVEARADGAFGAVAPGPWLEVVATPVGPPPAGVDLLEGGELDLETRPGGLPAGGRFEWTVIRCGAGRAELRPHPADPPGPPPPVAARPRVRLAGVAAGEVTVSVEYRLRGVTATGSRSFRVGIGDLADGETIAADGDRSIGLEAAVGAPEEGFDPLYLVEHASGVTFDGADPRMRISVDRRLERLTELLGDGADLSRLRVLRAFDDGATGLHGVGRALVLTHLDLDAGALAALAHRAGFGWVARRGDRVFCAEPAGEDVEIVLAADGAPLPEELPLGTPVELALRPAGLEGAGRFDWSLEPVGPGWGRLVPLLRRTTTFTPERAGLARLNALFVQDAAGATAPYTFELRLRPELDLPATIIPKDQYDLVMNVLAHFHPVGVEVLTRNLREHVVEVREDLLNAFPGYTYPEFRA